MSSSKSKPKLAVLSDRQFAKLFEDCKLELKLRIERESKVAYKVETRKEEQQTTKLSHLSDLKFKVVLLDAVLEFEGRSKENQVEAAAATSANTADTKVKEEYLNPQDVGNADHRKHRDSLLLAMLKLDTNIAQANPDHSVDDRNTPPSSPHLPSYPLNSTNEKYCQSSPLSRSTMSLPPIASQVTRMAEKSRVQLGYLLKCYSIALSPNPGVVIKQMKSCISALRDLSEIVEGYVEALAISKSGDTRHGDNTCVFLECMVQLIGSSIRVIMANFSPSLEVMSSEAIRVEIGKIVFMVDSLQLALSIPNASSGDLSTSTLRNKSGGDRDGDGKDNANKSLSYYATLEIKHLIEELEQKCPSMRPPFQTTATARLDSLLSPLHLLQTDFKGFLKNSFQPAFLAVLLGRACSADGNELNDHAIRKLVHFLVVQVSAILQETRSKSKREQSKSELFIQVVNDALQALVAVCRSTSLGEIGVSEHGYDGMVELMEGMYDLERGLEGLLDLESLQMQMPKPDELQWAAPFT